jgi:putative flippase GtrA
MIKLTIKYALFAVIATAVNLLTQRLLDQLYSGPLSYLISLFAGTLAGLIVKYILDKKYIFNYIVKTKAEDARKFMLYSIMGIATTAIFWGFQTAFFLLFKYEYAKFIGAAIGLSIGYFVKYQLDKRFVFKTTQALSSKL